VIDAEAFARLLCDWCLELEPDQQVLIATTTLAEPLVAALHRAALERRAWPLLRLTPPQLAEDFYRYAQPPQLEGYAPLELTEVESIDAWVRVDAPANTRALSGVDPALLTRASRARAAIQEARLRLRWCATLWPTAALAQQAGLGLAEYEEFIGRALCLDRPDPVAAWAELSRRQQSLVDRLTAAREIRIQGPGTDLRLRVDGRTWINSDGRRNMPSGEVFTGPLEDSAEGTIRFEIPSSPRGVEVQGVELTFSAGRVVAARADRGEDYLLAALDTDPGARFLGELGIGTNPGIDRPTGSILLDEKIAGTVHLALGRSYPETGGRNASALHWDLICDLRPSGGGGRLTADGEPIDPLSSR
jgi:aminopeptidase